MFSDSNSSLLVEVYFLCEPAADLRYLLDTLFFVLNLDLNINVSDLPVDPGEEG